MGLFISLFECFKKVSYKTKTKTDFSDSPKNVDHERAVGCSEEHVNFAHCKWSEEQSDQKDLVDYARISPSETQYKSIQYDDTGTRCKFDQLGDIESQHGSELNGTVNESIIKAEIQSQCKSLPPGGIETTNKGGNEPEFQSKDDR